MITVRQKWKQWRIIGAVCLTEEEEFDSSSWTFLSWSGLVTWDLYSSTMVDQF